MEETPSGSKVYHDGAGELVKGALEGTENIAGAAERGYEGARAMRHPQHTPDAKPDHVCSPANCYPGCGHNCAEGRGTRDDDIEGASGSTPMMDALRGLKRRRGFKDAADECPPGEGEVGTPSYRWESASNKTADELFAAQPNGKTQRLLLGDRRSTLDGLVNKIRGRRLGNLKKPFSRDARSRDQLMSSTRSMERGEVEDARAARDVHEGFAKVERSVAHEKGIRDPAAVAAAIGRKKYGAKGMARKAAAAR